MAASAFFTLSGISLYPRIVQLDPKFSILTPKICQAVLFIFVNKGSPMTLIYKALGKVLPVQFKHCHSYERDTYKKPSYQLVSVTPILKLSACETKRYRILKHFLY